MTGFIGLVLALFNLTMAIKSVDNAIVADRYKLLGCYLTWMASAYLNMWNVICVIRVLIL